MNANSESGNAGSFLVGMLAGSVIGAGVAMWLAPRAARDIRQLISDSASEALDHATGRYQDVKTRLADTAEVLTQTGQDVRDDVADAVLNGANEVGRRAAAAKTGASDRPGRRA